MKTIIEEYKNEIKKLVVNPRYIIPVIFVAILSYLLLKEKMLKFLKKLLAKE